MMERPVALVTGARRGIGKAIALELADAGFDVAVTDVQPSAELDGVCNSIRDRGSRAHAVISDLGDIETHEALFQNIEQHLGRVSCLVNNAGVSVLSRGDLLNVSAESYDRCLGVNTRGTFFLMQAFGKRFAGAGGAMTDPQPSIITITSSNAVAASPQRAEYCVSKAALSMATTLFSLRLAPLGVNVYEVQPGFIETEMTAPSKARYDALIDQGLTAIKRWGKPSEVAKTIRTLATGGLPYSVGQAIRVDGGLLINKY
ncbi:short chain dehydrogenase/reductase family oxidoreductase [Caballeronia arationis]|jgi:NAD(P)-dependent dehydrogenase (short-subunit alcohol dehydrogenase family)|uniref:NAD(P)-dependent dehydrogenase, short-chain alcohol dehydrogenase family n=1 Tax=Caballeronia arationis TaxID=1777142 RepID=A0A7Z7N0W3_9BURK|nr:3-ketoacyl-ACP reductase [Caballeronia arationis]SAL04553.1 short chain dehydrogenase/reductase family oxidoreductase [Caballeronia arationis]SOE54987.1 NAD(P)-dependent dehydrogenase, short-chain alcohol dehydrogenase family [Caballeronia arationis]